MREKQEREEDEEGRKKERGERKTAARLKEAHKYLWRFSSGVDGSPLRSRWKFYGWNG